MGRDAQIGPRVVRYRREVDGAEMAYDTFTGRLSLKYAGERRTTIRRFCSSSEARHEAATRGMRAVAS